MADRFPVLSGVDLEVEVGESVVVEGPNGAGKTSLLRLCCGLLAPVEGEAEILGWKLASKNTSVRKQVGMLGHHAFLYEELTVLENLRFVVRATGGPAKVERQTLLHALDRVGLSPRVAATQAGRLSAGQRRRAALAVLVARSPRLWLLDEPHAGLDLKARNLLDEIVREARDGGATILIASHEPERALPLATRVVTMAGGRVVASRAVPRVVADLEEDQGMGASGVA